MYLHLWVPGFHAAVAQVIEPALAGRMVAVAADTTPSASIYAVSAEARAAGLFPGWKVSSAQRRYPRLAVRVVDGERAQAAHQRLAAIGNQWTPRVGGSAGRVDLDLAGTEALWAWGLQGSEGNARERLADPVAQAVLIAEACQHACRQRLHLPGFVGGAQSLLVARLTARLARDEGVAQLVAADAALWPRLDLAPARWLPGLDRHALAALRDCGLQTIGQVRALTAAELTPLLGPAGATLAAVLQGQDAEIVPEAVDPEPVCSLVYDADDAGLGPAAAEDRAITLMREIGFRLRRQRQACAWLQVRVRWRDGREAHRRHAFVEPAHHDDDLVPAVRALVRALTSRRVHLARIRCTAGGLGPAQEQHVLFDRDRQRRLECACDRVHERFQEAPLYRARAGRGE